MYYALYKGNRENKVPANRVLRVGIYLSPASISIRCCGVEFIYKTEDAVLRDWQFFVPITKMPVSRSKT